MKEMTPRSRIAVLVVAALLTALAGQALSAQPAQAAPPQPPNSGSAGPSLSINPCPSIGEKPINWTGTDGNDFGCGSHSEDFLRGQGGHDRLLGYDGDDYLYGGTGSDGLYGSRGDDSLFPGEGLDVVQGSVGNDRIVVHPDGQRDYIFGDQGTDIVVLGCSGLESIDQYLGVELAQRPIC
jgi:Ca2+-binding RTX toxin-like protein